MLAALYGLSLDGLGSSPAVKVVGILCGALIGGYFGGVLTHLAFKSLTLRKAPGPAVLVGRGLSAAIVGFLLYLILFGPGGTGIGGPGGWGLSGWGFGESNPPPDPTKDKDKDKDEGGKDDPSPKPPDPPPDVKETLIVEVLGSAALEKLQGESFDAAKRYRIKGPDGPELLALDALKGVIAQRQTTEGETFRRVHIVLYRDSPAPGTPWVNDLKAHVEGLAVNDDEKMRVSIESDKNHEAPVSP